MYIFFILLMKINFEVGNIINCIVGYLFTTTEIAEDRLRIQITMVVFKLTNKKKFYSTFILFTVVTFYTF